MPEPPLKRLEELFHRAAALPPDQRPTYLSEACAGDADLRAAVEDLLRLDVTGTIPSPVSRRPGQESVSATTILPSGASGPTAPAGLPQVPGYELLRVLGHGGMGVVYLARHVALDRRVALKMLSDVRATPEQVVRFRGEAEALARLQHPNVVPIYDVGEFEGHPYFTMEYVAGPSLAALLDGRPQDVVASARLVETLARAAHAVHQCGIVHRDLKPANVLLQTTEHTEDTEKRQKDPSSSSVSSVCSVVSCCPKITDFGIARDRAAARRLTEAGAVMGTPGYMAPEQVDHAPGAVGPGADVYALGSILYEMLTGRPPFDGETPLETIAQLVNQEPLSPARLRPRLPADLVTVCLKCLEKSPHRRYASAWELAEDLRRFQAGEPIKARPVGPVGRAYRWCRRRPLVAGLSVLSAVLAVALVVTVVAYLAGQAEEERQEIVRLDIRIAVLEEADGDAFTAVLWLAEALRLDEAAGVSGSDHRARIAAALRQCPRLVRMRTHNEQVVCTSLTPSAGWVATAGADRVVKVWDVKTGEQRGMGLRPGEVALDGALSVDGRLLATIGGDGTVRVWDVLSAKSRELPLGGTEPVRRLAFPAGGRVLLTEHADAAVRLWDLTKDEPSPLPSPWNTPAAFTALSDEAHWLVVQDKGLAARVWDMANGKAVGASPPLTHAVTAAAVSADGRRVALLEAGGGLRVWDVAAAAWLGGPMRPRENTNRLAFCPDGERVITAGPDPGAQVWRAGTGEVIDLDTRKGATDAHIRFSPDGRFAVARQGTWARVWDLTTGHAVTPPLRHGTPVVAASFSAGGRQVVTVSRAGTVRVWDMPPPLARGGGPAPDGLPEGNAPGPGDPGWDGRPGYEIIAWAHLLACARINPRQQPEALDEAALREAWESLRRR
jgi:serine/threonine protein kinase/WD40 repeat protein